MAEIRSIHAQWKAGTLDLTRKAYSSQAMIQEMLDGGVSKSGIARDVGVSEMTIYLAITGQTRSFKKIAELHAVYEKWKAIRVEKTIPTTPVHPSGSFLPDVNPEMIAALERRIEIMKKQVGLMRELMTDRISHLIVNME